MPRPHQMKASIIIRTLNEERHLPDLLASIKDQDHPNDLTEVVLIDSGSKDGTLKIAERFGCRIEHISRTRFSFGRSLNVGCAAASGEALVFISGHCLPLSKDWLRRLLEPLDKDGVVLTYGRQLGNGTSFFSEKRIFEKYFPRESRIPQEGFFCNNANSALLARVWKDNPFDETLTGLEDMHLAKKLVTGGMKIGYVAEAPVYHIHDETWSQVKLRFEREAIALQHIMPEVHLTFLDFLRFFASALLFDFGAAIGDRVFLVNCFDIFMYRLVQYWGSYRGNSVHRRLSHRQKETYFYPR